MDTIVALHCYGFNMCCPDAYGFVAHYLVPLIYPAGLAPDIQWLLAGVVVAVNLAVYGALLVQRRTARA